MSKLLILVRHAKSDWSVPGQKDFDRTLNERGHRDAPKMGKWLADKNLGIQTLISSPAERAKLTAVYFAEQLKYDIENIIYNENLYEASARVWMNEVTQLANAWHTVAMFGHNPGISYFAEYLTKENMDEVPTCAVIGIRFDIDDWAMVSGSTGRIEFYHYPKNFE